MVRGSRRVPRVEVAPSSDDDDGTFRLALVEDARRELRLLRLTFETWVVAINSRSNTVVRFALPVFKSCD